MSVSMLIYAYNATDLYSFNTGADTRYFSFAGLFSTEFTNFATVYNNYKILSVSCIITPMYSSSSTITYPLLQVGCDPEVATPGNPTNSSFIFRDTNHLFTAKAVAPKSVTFTFPGTGITTNVWKSTADTPSGCLYIGNQTSTGIFSSTGIAFEGLFSALVKFANVK